MEKNKMRENNINKLIKIIDKKGKPIKDILVASPMELRNNQIEYHGKLYELKSTIDKIDDFGIFRHEYTFEGPVSPEKEVDLGELIDVLRK
jgi:hypothetical protein